LALCGRIPAGIAAADLCAGHRTLASQPHLWTVHAMTSPIHSSMMHGGAERLPIRWVNAAPPPTVISRYRVAPGQSVSLHMHTGKSENWVIVSGSGTVRVGDASFVVTEGDIVVT